MMKMLNCGVTSWRLVTVFKLLCVFVYVPCFISRGYAQRIPEFNPSNIPPGTEIIYLDEHGNVIGNKTLILPDNLDLKFNVEDATTTSETPSSSDSSHQNGQIRTDVPVQQTFSEVPPSLLPKDWPKPSGAAETTQSARPAQIKFEAVPDSFLPKDFQNPRPPTGDEEARKPSLAASSKPADTKFESVPDSLLPEGWRGSTKPAESVTQGPLSNRNGPSKPSQLQFESISDSLLPEGYHEFTESTEATTETPARSSTRRPFARPSTLKIENVPESFLPEGFRESTNPTEKVPTQKRPVPVKFEKISDSLLPAGFHESTTHKPLSGAGKPTKIQFEDVPDSLLPKGFDQSARPAQTTTQKPPRLSTRRQFVANPDDIKIEDIPESLLPAGWHELTKPTDGIGMTEQVASGSIKSELEPEDGLQINGSVSGKSTKSEESDRQSRRLRAHKSSSKSNVYLSKRKNGEISSDDSPGMNKNTLPESNASKGRDPENDGLGKIKSVGVKTTINTSFRIAQTPDIDAGSPGSTGIKASAEVVKEESSISRSTETQPQKSNNEKPLFDLKDLEIPISAKDFKLNLSSPINITTGNYTITFFGKPPQQKTDSSKSVPPTATINDSLNPAEQPENPSIATAAPTAKPVNESLPTESAPGTTEGRGRLRWPLNRRRKISTARRFLLRTRKPLPTRRTPRPLRPTKSSRPSKWSPRSRPPPRFTTRLNIFKKFQTIPTKPPTTPTTTTEHVYTRKPSSVDTLTSDYIKSSGVIKLEDGVEWSNSLADKNSKEFKTLALDLKVLLQEVFKNSVWAPVFIRVDIDGFYKGSVVCDFDAVFKRAIANRIKAIHLKKILIDTLNRDGGQLGDYTVNKTSVIFDAFTDLIDPELSTPASKEEEPVLPQWAIAVIVVSLASLLFVILFSCVAWCNKPFAKKRQNDRFLDDGGETEKPPLGGYDNLAIDSFYDLEEWKRPVKQSKQPGRAQKKRRDRYYDSWKTEWSGYKGPTRPAMSEF